MSALRRYLQSRLTHLSPKQIDRLIGIGLAADPIPYARYQTFETSDVRAMWADWSAVGRDMRVALSKAHNERSGTA